MSRLSERRGPPVALAIQVDSVEDAEVERAMREGWTWSQIAEAQRLAAIGVAVGDYLATPRAPRRGPRFATSGKQALHRSLAVAAARKDRHIGSPHLLVGLLRADIGTVPRALAVADVDRVALLGRAERLLD